MRREGIADTCFCLDLWYGHLLGLISALGVRIIIPDVVVNELRDPEVEPFLSSGAIVQSADPAEVLLVENLRQSYRKPSLADLFSLAMAKNRKAILLTNDKHLRTAAQEEKVEFKGILWLLDSLEIRLSVGQLAQALESILEHGAHLPRDECNRRLAKWRSQK